MTRRNWTPTEISVLRNLYAIVSTGMLASAMNRSVHAVHAKASQLGVGKPPERIKQTLLTGETGKNTRFQKGMTPWNKGVSGSTGRHPNSRKTQFKRGEMRGAARHNYVPIGSLRVTRYGALEQKVTDDPALYPARRWRPAAHLVWERERGLIPAGHVVRFKLGMHTTDYDEITIDRLECITYAENMRRNSVHNYPPEIVGAVRARAALNRRINREQQDNR